MSEIAFEKMHGLGNDFIFLNENIEISPEQIAKLCDRHKGIGADGLIIVTKDSGNIIMNYWNADGSIAEMCGNGLRCTVKYAVDHKLVEPGEFSVKTGAGLLSVNWDGKSDDEIEVQVGKVEVGKDAVVCGLDFHKASVGNPHAITYVESVENAPVAEIGQRVEVDKEFPNRTNVEFAKVNDNNTIDLRIWERGVGETLACGTGMVSTAVVAESQRKVVFPVQVNVPGGTAKIWTDDQGFARMLAPARTIFKGITEL